MSYYSFKQMQVLVILMDVGIGMAIWEISKMHSTEPRIQCKLMAFLT